MKHSIKRSMKHKNLSFGVRFAAVLIALSSLVSLSVSAEGTSKSNGAPGYVIDRVYRGTDLGTTEMNAPRDMCLSNNFLYILDSGNSRILKLNVDFQIETEITLKNDKGEAVSFPNAEGLCVDKNNRIYVAVEDQSTVIVANPDGFITDYINQPDGAILPEGFDYRPNKVLVDSTGLVYILSKGTGLGALQYDNNFQFINFYGSERVQMTFQMQMDRIWRKLLNKKQTDAMSRYTPTSYVNFDSDKNDFIYTISEKKMRKLNAASIDISAKMDALRKVSLLKDIEVDQEGFITLLDERDGRIYQLNQEGEILFSFGAKGNQEGTFREPTALETVNGNILVLDKEFNNLAVFQPTDFALQVRKALLLYDDGRFGDAMQPWKQALQYNEHYSIANRGIGMAYLKNEQYQEAMGYFKQAGDIPGYSQAFKGYRDLLINQYFAIFLIGLILLIAIPMYLVKRAAVRSKNEYLTVIGKYQYPTYCMFHPFKGYSNLKNDKLGSIPIAITLLFLFFLARLFLMQSSGFQVVSDSAEGFNLILELVRTVGVVVVFTAANWAVSTILDGEGTYREVFIFGTYSLTPYIIGSIPLVLLSNFVAKEEMAFYSMLQAVIIIWTILSIIMAVKEVQQFSLAKTLFIIVLTIIGIILTFSVVAIIYSMISQMFTWVVTVFNELMLRM